MIPASSLKEPYSFYSKHCSVSQNMKNSALKSQRAQVRFCISIFLKRHSKLQWSAMTSHNQSTIM